MRVKIGTDLHAKWALSFCSDIDTLSVKRIAENRGNTKIMQCLGMQANPFLPIPILQRIPKSEEFPYVNVMEKLKNMIMMNKKFEYKELLKTVHAKGRVNFSETL